MNAVTADPAAPDPGLGLTYRPSLDGVRALAILMVIGYHERALLGGFLGVDVFFVLSGYLITAILLREWEGTGSIGLPRFYVRRFLRLAPALCLFVGANFLVAWWPVPGFAGWVTTKWALVALLYVSNLLIAYGREYPLGGVSHCWSLALEEQFYLLWPFGLRTLLRSGLRRNAVAAVLALLVVACFAWRYALLAWGSREGGSLWLRLYFAPETRADGLLSGCLLALLVRRTPTGRLAALAAPGAAVGMIVLGYLAATRQIVDFVAHPFLFSVSATASVLVVLAALVPGIFRRALEWPLLVWIGQLSYSLYLWHPVGLGFLRFEHPVKRHAFVFGLAIASHYLVERPVLRLNRHFGAIPRPHPRLLPRMSSAAGTGPTIDGALGPGLGLAALAVVLALGHARLTGGSLPGLRLPPLVQARERLADGDLQNAIVQYRQAAEGDVGDGSVLAEMAQALLSAGDGQGAVDASRVALGRRPEDPKRHVALATALLQARRPAEARAAFQRAIELDPDNGEAHAGLGALALNEGRAQEAIAELSRVAQLRPRDAVLHNQLGVAHALAGSFDEAIRHFTLSLELKPDASVAANLERARIDRARSLAPGQR